MTGARNGADVIADIGGQLPPLLCLVLFTTSGTATLTGFFVDESGQQIVTDGNYSYTLSITTTPKTLLELLTAGSKNCPQGAAGFVGQANANISFSTGGLAGATPAALATDIGTNKAYYPVLTAGTFFPLGRVG